MAYEDDINILRRSKESAEETLVKLDGEGIWLKM